MGQRLPGQAGNGRKACTRFRHLSNVPARRRATHLIYLASIHCRHSHPIIRSAGPGLVLGDLVKQSGMANARMRPDASCI
jgi:hypothetical protein